MQLVCAVVSLVVASLEVCTQMICLTQAFPLSLSSVHQARNCMGVLRACNANGVWQRVVFI